MRIDRQALLASTLFAVLIWCVACSGERGAGSAEASRSAGPADDRLQLEVVVRALAVPGSSRRVGSEGHARARAYLELALEDAGCAPLSGDSFALEYTVGGVVLANYVGVARGQDSALPPLLIGAHYDTCGDQPGADDNAAAVAAALSCARHLTAAPLQRDVWIALFDAEEPPHFLTPAMGSTIFREQQAPREVHAAVILDLVGHDTPLPGAEDAVFSIGAESAPGMAAVVEALVERTDLLLVTTRQQYIGDMSDYHAFRLARDPWLFFSCGRWEHYHQPTDTPDVLNFEKLLKVRDLTLEALRELDAVELLVDVAHDTLELELATLNRLLGRIDPAGETSVSTRAELGAVVRKLQRQSGL